MVRLLAKIKKLEEKAEEIWIKHKKNMPKIFGIALAVLYFYGMAIRSVIVGIQRVWQNSTESLLSWSPFQNIGAVFSPAGFMITLFIVIIFCLFNKKGYSLISGYKTVRDKERGIEILPEGTHGTSGWMSKKEISGVLEVGRMGFMDETLFGKLPDRQYVGTRYVEEYYRIRRAGNRKIQRLCNAVRYAGSATRRKPDYGRSKSGEKLADGIASLCADADLFGNGQASSAGGAKPRYDL